MSATADVAASIVPLAASVGAGAGSQDDGPRLVGVETRADGRALMSPTMLSTAIPARIPSSLDDDVGCFRPRPQGLATTPTRRGSAKGSALARARVRGFAAGPAGLPDLPRPRRAS
ncbi:MAG: hypothetical protein DCF29_20895 [Alphaproteobacteria bacterium]|nr:MAG: hypothetical protein DCF29_20895 [Alphaproteobacteria bacterium]